MSDLWPFPAASPPSTIHQSSRSNSLPPFSTWKHGSPLPAKVSSPHIYPSQNTSPLMCPPQLSSPNLGLWTQASSFQFPQSTITSPHLSPQMEVSPSHLFYQQQITSPHIPSAQVSSSYNLGSPQMNSPLLHSPQVTSPHLTPQSHQFLYNNPDPDLDYGDWDRSDASSDLSCYLNGSSLSYQNQSPSPLDIHLQNQYSTSETSHMYVVERANKAYNTHTIHINGMFDQRDQAGQAQQTWDSMSPTLSQVQCPSLGSTSVGDPMGRWNSIEVKPSPVDDFSNNQFYNESYHGSNTQQPFCSPTTPGPSPHYPQPQAVSSPGPQMHPRTERTACPKQASNQLNRDPTSGRSLNDPSSFFSSSDKAHQHSHQRTQRHPQSQRELPEEAATNSLKTRFSPQKRGPPCSGSGPTLGTSVGLRIKQLPPMRSTESLDSRCWLLCTVCKREFKSLPALNGHMRSHRGFRSPTRQKKDNSPTTQSSVSFVMPVSVPVQTRGTFGQRNGSIPSPSPKGNVLYRSLMHDKEQDSGSTGNEDGGMVLTPDKGHYTPPPMLCPKRAGSGLFCSLTTRRQHRVGTIQLHSLSDSVLLVTSVPKPEPLASANIKPRINFGKTFQAEIPPLLGKKYAQADSHNALLLCTPYDELERPVNQQRVDALLMMARSSVVPGGRSGQEYALQLLSECRGDFLLTVEKLLFHPESSQNQSGVRWSAAEKKLLVKSLQIHHKDFRSVQKAVRSKSLSECVEYYYLWKKKLSLSIKTPTGLTVSLPETNGQKGPKPNKVS